MQLFCTSGFLFKQLYHTTFETCAKIIILFIGTIMLIRWTLISVNLDNGNFVVLLTFLSSEVI